MPNLPAPRWFASILLLLAIGLVLAAAPARADGGLVLAPQHQEVQAWPALTLLSDPGQAMDLAGAQRRRAEFRPPQSPAGNLGVRRDAVWLHLPLQVASGDGRWVFDIDYPTLQRAELYLVSDGRLLQQWRLGSDQPFDARPMPSRGHAVEMALEPGRAYELYLRVSTQTSMVLPITLNTPQHYHRREAAAQLWQGLINGIALALLAYSVVHGLALRSALFGLYAALLTGSTTFFLVFFGVGQQYLWPDPGLLSERLAPLSVLLALAAGSLFVALALDTAQRNPRLHRGLQLLSAASAACFLLSAAGLVDYRATQLMATLLGPLLMLLSIPAAWMRARSGDPVGVYMLIGWTSYLVGAMSMAALLRGLLPANAVTLQLFQWGSIIEMLAWVRVLGLHVEAAQREAERSQHEKQLLLSLAHTDSLTGLPNRRGLQLAMAQALPRCALDHVLAVFLIDLDGFKPINDRLGHDAGDTLLLQVGQRLRQHLRGGDTVARLGGDEFVIMAEGLAGEAEAQRLGGKLLRAFEAPFDIEGQACRVGLTIGFALAPHDGREAGDLLKRADAAMYAGKQAGRHTVRRGAASAGLVS